MKNTIIGMINENFIKKFIFLFIVLFLSCSSNDEKKVDTRVNCGEIIRLYQMNINQEEGNPCGGNRDYSRQYAFIVRNNITGNTKHFCVNLSEFINYKLGSNYCDKMDPSGW